MDDVKEIQQSATFTRLSLKVIESYPMHIILRAKRLEPLLKVVEVYTANITALQCSLLVKYQLQVDFVLTFEELSHHHWNWHWSSTTIHPNERLSLCKRLWKKFSVWDDDLTHSIQTTLNPEEVIRKYIILLYTQPLFVH